MFFFGLVVGVAVHGARLWIITSTLLHLCIHTSAVSSNIYSSSPTAETHSRADARQTRSFLRPRLRRRAAVPRRPARVCNWIWICWIYDTLATSKSVFICIALGRKMSSQAITWYQYNEHTRIYQSSARNGWMKGYMQCVCAWGRATAVRNRLSGSPFCCPHCSKIARGRLGTMADSEALLVLDRPPSSTSSATVSTPPSSRSCSHRPSAAWAAALPLPPPLASPPPTAAAASSASAPPAVR